MHSDPKSVICDTNSCPCKNIGVTLSIWTAAQVNDIARVKFIGDTKRERLNKYDTYGYSALHYAAQGNHVEIVKYLLLHRVPVDGNECGCTPLHRAAASGSFESCELLIQHGADDNARDISFGDNLTPLEKAVKMKHEKVIDLFLLHSTSYTRDDINALSAKFRVQEATAAANVEFPEVPAQLTYCQPIRTPLPLTKKLCGICNQPSLSFHKTSKGNLICIKCKKLNRISL